MENKFQKIVKDKLLEKKALAPCPRCNNKNFTLIEKPTYFSLQEDPDTMVMGGPSIPTAILVCSNCGYMVFHATLAIEIDPKKIE